MCIALAGVNLVALATVSGVHAIAKTFDKKVASRRIRDVVKHWLLCAYGLRTGIRVFIVSASCWVRSLCVCPENSETYVFLRGQFQAVQKSGGQLSGDCR